jgi:uncharacterized protein (TIGR02145 family)
LKKITIILLAFIAIVEVCYSQTVTIGTQVWSEKNLAVSTFRNGDPIPEAKTYAEWREAAKNQQPAWCYYENKQANEEVYGKLYNWYAVNDSRGLAPEGWRIPSDEDWTVLIDFLGGGREAGVKMKSTTLWDDYVGSGNGTNESGFLGLPGGCRNQDADFYFFEMMGEDGGWWCSTARSSTEAWCRSLIHMDGVAYRSYYEKVRGLSVRCVKNN